MTKHRTILILPALYLLAGVITFGHAAAESQRSTDAERAICQTNNTICPGDVAPMVGLMAGLFWPLYWSWEAFE